MSGNQASLAVAPRDWRQIEADMVQQLQDLQYSPETPVLLFTQDPTGLGSQISRRLLGLRLALRYRRQVVFPSLSEPPYTQVFKPLHRDVDYAALERVAEPFAFTPDDTRPVLKLNFWDLYENAAEWSAISEWVPYTVRGVQNSKYIVEGALLNFCQLTEQRSAAVNAARQRLQFTDRTLGVHFRRGDKQVETPFVPADVMSRAIAERVAAERIDSVFVASDSPDALNELMFPAGVRVIFDASEKRYNNANHKFLTQHPELAEEETATAIKNIFLLGSCACIVGQDNAHFATLAAGLICRRLGRNPSVLIPGHQAILDSRRSALVHSLRVSVRGAAKRLFPWATLRHRGRS